MLPIKEFGGNLASRALRVGNQLVDIALVDVSVVAELTITDIALLVS